MVISVGMDCKSTVEVVVGMKIFFLFSAHLFDRIVSRKLTSSVTEKISVSLSIHFTDSRKLTSEREEGECEVILFIFFPIFTNLYFKFQESDRESIRSEKVQQGEDVLASDESNVDAQYVRGLCHYFEDDTDKAIKCLAKALTIAPNHGKAKDTKRKAELLKSKGPPPWLWPQPRGRQGLDPPHIPSCYQPLLLRTNAVNFLLPFSHDPDGNILIGDLDQDSNLSNCFAFFSIELFKI